MTKWEYHVEIISLEFGPGKEWSFRDSTYGHTKLNYRLDEYGNHGWGLVSLLPLLSEQGIPIVPPAVYAVFKKAVKKAAKCKSAKEPNV
jgi:hypothetical protein